MPFVTRPRISFRIDAKGLVQSLNTYLAAVQNGQARTDLIRNQMRFAVQGIIDLTPPNTLAEGRAAVKRDISNAMTPWGGASGQFKGIKAESLRARLVSYLATGQYGRLREVWNKIGARSGLRLLDFDPALHHSVQNDRGHVPVPKNVMVLQTPLWRNYVTMVQQAVGRARGGWAYSAALVGLDLPDWVRRHKDGGDATLLVTPGKATYVFINNAVFIPNYQSAVEVALQGRSKAMETDARRFLEGAKTFAGLGR